MARPTLIDVPGIGAATAVTLTREGIRNVAELARAPIQRLAAVHGFGPARAAAVKEAAQALAVVEKSGAGKRRGKKKGKKAKDKKARGKKGKGKKGKGKKGKGKKGKGKKGKGKEK